MPLIEVLLGSLGPAIGKSLLKLWLKDQELAVDVGSSVIDLLKQKGMDFATQRAGARAFERIGDEVAQSLKPLFKDARLEENEQEAVALAVAETLEKARIDTTLLAEKNLEPTVLAKFLIDSRALAARDLSERASTLYERILQEVARRIVAIAAQLPGFQVEALGEVLRREDELLRYAVEILEKVRELEEASRAANPTLRYAEFETKYRETVLRKLDRVQLIGVDVSATSREQRLSMAYISLRVAENWERLILSSITHITGDGGERETLAVTKEQVLKRLRAMGKEQFIQRSAALFDTSSFGLYRAATAEEVFDLLVQSPSDDRAGGRAERAVEEALAGRQRLLIRGIAGSGKTTLLKWIAVNAAGRKFSGRLEEWNDAVPFFLPLREYVDRELPTPDEFIRSTSKMTEAPDGWVRHCLNAGRAIVLVDSVDELPENQRENVRDWLNDLIINFGKARIVVTSRPSAIEEGWLERESFEDAELLPMRLPDILAFVEHWHDAVRAEARNEEEKLELERLKEDLQGQIKENRPIQNLATNPLLCAAFCALHRERKGRVPADRIRLYDACCEMLLERRGQDQNLLIETRYLPDLNYRDKRALLADLAYWMMRNGFVEITEEEAKDQLARNLQNMPRGANLEVEKVWLLLVERSGIVREPRVGYLDFIHRTFQEFLAAQAAVNLRDIGFLVERADDDRWRETIILAAGLANNKDAETLIRKLLERGDSEPDLRHTAYLLAVACLETAVHLPSELQNAVVERLQTVVPPRSMEEATAIARAGELAVPFLKDGKKYEEEQSAFCIHALELIGGEVAFEALKSYQDEVRIQVIQALFDAAESFDRHTYFQEVLAGLVAPRIELRRVTSLDGFQLLKRVKHLRLEGSEQVSDLTSLASLTNLTEFNIWSMPLVSDLTPLASLTNLTELTMVDMSNVSDLAPLATLINLTNLDLVVLRHVSDLTPLASLTNLTELTIWSMPLVSDLTPLASLTNLTTLELYEMRQVSDLTPLVSLTKLTNLILQRMGQVTDLSFLENLKDLRIRRS